MKRIGFDGAPEGKQSRFGRILMRVLIFGMLLSAIPAGVAANEVVTFQDTNLEAEVRDELDKSEGDITTDDIATLSELDADEEGISNLTGLEYAVNLRELDLGENKISDLSPLANLTNLRELDLGGNQISDIGPLTNLTNLRELDLEGNQISDIGPLANLTNLEELDLESNEISDIGPLVANSELGSDDSVDLDHNNLDLSPGSAAMRDIEALEERGVDLSYTSQRG